MITAGIDMGSRSIKVVLLEELKVDGAPQLKYGVKKAYIMMPGDLDQDVAADKAYNEALAEAGLAQGNGIGQIEQRETVSKVFERAGRAHQAVAVGIGLDDGPQARRAGMLACNGQIAAQGGKIDGGAGRAGQVGIG